MFFVRKRSAGIKTTLCALAAAALLGAAPARAPNAETTGKGSKAGSPNSSGRL